MEEAIIAIVGLGVIPLVNWLKQRFSLSGRPVLFLVAAVSVVVGLAALVVAGEVGFSDFSVDNLSGAFGLVIGAALFAYRLIGSE